MLKLVAFDVDGCMTNGGIGYDANNNEIKFFDVKDGLAIASLHKLGIKTAIITGRESSIVANRAKELKIDYLFQGAKHKGKKLEEIVKTENLRYAEIAYIGDDINDVPILRRVGYSFAPNDATKYAKEAAKITLSKKGGEGAVREMLEILFVECDLVERFKELWV